MDAGLASYSNTAATNSAIASANNATLAAVGMDRPSMTDLNAAVAAALLTVVTQVALDALALRDSRLDAAEASTAALQAAGF